MGSSRTLTIEVVATGNELVFGQLVDTNSFWIARRVVECGGLVKRITCVGDDAQDIKVTIREALAHECDLVVVTGGLGPTADDLTMQSLAEALDRRVVLDERALEKLKGVYEKLSRERGEPIELTPRRRKMASILEGSEPLENDVGLAVGMKLRVGSALIVALPGVPSEMKAMFERHIVPLISNRTGKCVVARSVRVKMDWFGYLSPIVEKLTAEFRGVYMKAYAGDIKSDLGMRIDILAEGEKPEECKDTIKEVIKKLETYIKGRGIITLESRED